MKRSSRVIAIRGVAAASAVTAIIIGVPWALTTIVGWPLPHGWPSWARLQSAITNGDIPDRFWIGGLACVMWALWAAFTVSIIAETIAAIRGRDRAARWTGQLGHIGTTQLVAAIVLVVSLATSRQPNATAATRTLVRSPTPPAVAMLPNSRPSPPPGRASPAPTQPGKQWTVERGDNLWRIAERTLGSGERYPEIVELNIGRGQPDGLALTDPAEIEPGWVLILPDDATLPGPPPAPAPTGTPTWVLGPNDSLWSIATKTLGDGQRWPEIWSLNIDRAQPSGAMLTNPDAIEDGTVLVLPTPPIEAPAPAPSSVAATPAPVPSASPAPGTPPPSTPEPGSSAVPPASQPVPVAPQAAPTTRPASNRVSSPPVDLGSEGSEVPWISAAGALLCGAVLWRLTRRRRLRQARRQPGDPVPIIGDLGESEQRLRSIADEDQVVWVDAFTRALNTAFEDLDRDIRPNVVLVRVGDHALETVLDRPADPPAWCVHGSDPQVWKLAPSIDLAALIDIAGDRPSATPALLTLGADPAGSVLLNLGWATTASVTGPDTEAAGFLAQAAIELATAPWSYDTQVRVHGPVGEIVAGVEETEVIEDLEDLIAGLEATPAANREAWEPQVLIVSGTVPDDLWTRLDAAVREADGSVLVLGTLGKREDRAEVVLDDGSLRLEPLGLVLTAVALAGDLMESAVQLLTRVDTDSTAVPPISSSGVDDRDVAGADAEADSATWDAIAKVLAPRPVEVRVLGPAPEIDGWSRHHSRAREELLVLLAMQPGPILQTQVKQALWPDDIKESTWRATLSRTRRALDRDGEPPRIETLAPLSGAGASRYQVSDQVGCDWNRFEQLLAGAKGATTAGDEAAWLQAALELVSGQPFGAVKARTYGWVFAQPDLLARMEARITDAAHHLAELAVEEGDLDTADWAAQQGQLAVPAQQALYEVRMSAAAQRGDPDAVKRILTEAGRALASVDPLEPLADRTRQVYDDCLDLAQQRRAEAT